MYNIRIKSIRNYYPHLTVIAALLFVNLFLAFSNKETKTEVIPQVQVEKPHYSPYQDFIDAHTYTDADCEYLMFDENDMDRADKDFQVKLEDGFVVIYERQRVVGTLSYNTSLGKMLLRDNQQTSLQRMVSKRHY
jgi:hypothetical protein